MITTKELTEQAYRLCQSIRDIIYKDIFDKPIDGMEKLLRVQNKAFRRYMRRRNKSEKFIEF